jgi:hypothetical protein
MSADAMAARDAQIRAIGNEFPGWEAWQGLINGLWHARQVGSTPPVMVHGESPDDLREQIRGRIGATTQAVHPPPENRAER